MNEFEFNTAWGGLVRIGESTPPFMVAEIGLNHNGSLDLAKRLVFEASLSGAHAVKLQKRSPSDLALDSFLSLPFPKAPFFGATQRQVRERLELSEQAYRELYSYASSLGLVFFASAFDPVSLEFLNELGVGLVKVASHSITNGPLLDAVRASGLPTILSTGAATDFEIETALSRLDGVKVLLMHCVSSYPTPDSELSLDNIPRLRELFGVPVGFSSHESGIVGSIGAVAKGAVALERHFTMSRAMAGLDHSVSLEPSEFAELAFSVNRLFAMRGTKDSVLSSELVAKNQYHVGIYPTRNIGKGEVISREDVCVVQPLVDPELYFSGLDLGQVVGMVAQHPLVEGSPIPRNTIAPGPATNTR